MNYLVKDYLGKKGKKGNIGIEIEVEAAEALPEVKNDSWVSHHEGSLRALGNMEYVTNGPLVISEVPKALKDIYTLLKPYKVDHKSHRASVHVHSNVLYHTPIQYWNMAVSYWLTEELLFDFCGDNRKGNCFCLRLNDAEGVIKHCLEDLRSDTPFRRMGGRDQIRYSGQNLEATSKFGSIEYRGMSFTLDPEKISTWTTGIHDLNVNSKDFKSPDLLMDSYFSSDPEDFLSRLFNKDFVNILTKSPLWKEKLQENEGILCELAYVHDWEKWVSRIEKKREKNIPLEEPVEEFDDPNPLAPNGRANRPRAVRAVPNMNAFIQARDALLGPGVVG